MVAACAQPSFRGGQKPADGAIGDAAGRAGGDLPLTDLAARSDGASSDLVASVDLGAWDSATADLASPVGSGDDLSAPSASDLAVAPDLAAPAADLAVASRADLAAPAGDLKQQPAPPDLAARADLAATPDLVAAPDFARPPDLAAAPDLVAPPDLTVGNCRTIKINELQTGGNAGPEDEFVELYNPCGNDVALGGWQLDYRSAMGVNDVGFVLFGPMSLKAHGFLVAAHVNYTGNADVRYMASSMSYKGGGLGLFDAQGVLVDSVGYGAGATNAYVRVAPAPAPASATSTSRLPDGHDTRNNAADFTLTPSTPGAANHL